jgi:hypothetical protein
MKKGRRLRRPSVFHNLGSAYLPVEFEVVVVVVVLVVVLPAAGAVALASVAGAGAGVAAIVLVVSVEVVVVLVAVVLLSAGGLEQAATDSAATADDAIRMVRRVLEVISLGFPCWRF